MYNSLDHVLSLDISKEIPFIVSAYKNDRIRPHECSTAFLVGINVILKTSPKAQRREEITKLGWKLLEGVKAHQAIAQTLVHPNLATELLYNKPEAVTCSIGETERIVRWISDVTVNNNMAVKQHESDPNNKVKAELVRLEEIIRNLHETSSKHAVSELIQWWYRIINALANNPALKDINNIHTISALTSEIQEMMQRSMDSVNNNIKEELIFSILKHLYGIISRPGADPSPATAIVLSVIPPSIINNAVMYIIKSNTNTNQDPNEAGYGLRNTLLVLCRWLCCWNYTPILREWVLSLMKKLHECDKCDVLVDVAMQVIIPLFAALIPPSTREMVSDVFFYIMSSMRHCTEPFEKLAPQIPKVLELLACDSQNSRQLLQNLVDTISALLDEHVELKTKYPQIVVCLDAHICSNTSSLFNVPLWKITAPMQENDPERVGLINMGNTCYMNSVLQALVNTRQFSNRVLLNHEKQHLMMSLGSLFAMMTFSMRPSVYPKEFFVVSKPPSFNRTSQQDSSEFLCHLLDTLHEQEKAFRLNRIDLIGSGESSSIMQYAVSSSSGSSSSGMSSCSQDMDIMAIADMPDSSLINNMPMEGASTVANSPGSSSSVSSSSSCESASLKRTDPEDRINLPQIKRKYTGNAAADFKARLEYISANTIVQKTFGGVSITSIQCSHCKIVSKKRDIIRDLQLAFPDSPMANKPMHSKSYSVQELLNYYCSPEKMTGENQYKCDNCNAHRDAERSVTIEKAPKNLILVLKRFLYDPKTQIRAKLLTRVEHNRTVTVRCGHETITYELYAAVVHSGSQLDLGHYYTYAKDSSQVWYKYNDHWVHSCEEQDLHNLCPPNTPYILFYKQMGSQNLELENLKEGTSAEARKGDSPKSYNKCEAQNDEANFFDSNGDETVPLERLPQYLIDQVINDNSLYEEQSRRDTRSSRSNPRSPNYRRDQDDDPPSSCGGSSNMPENYNNRYIY